MFKTVNDRPDKLDLEIFVLEEFFPGSQKREGWLALEDDFRTLGIRQIVAEIPQFDEFLAQ